MQGMSYKATEKPRITSVNRKLPTIRKLTTANCGGVENHKTKIQNFKLRKTKAKKGHDNRLGEFYFSSYIKKLLCIINCIILSTK